MKKNLKKAGVAVLTMAMMLSAGAITSIPAYAADATINITVPESATGVTYKYIKIADATKVNERWEYSNLNAKFAGVLKLEAVSATLKTAADKDLGEIIDHGSEARELATSLADKVTDADLAAVPAKLGPGYYLLVDTSSKKALPVLLSITDEDTINIEAKIVDVPFNKKITKIETKGSTDNVISKADTANTAVDGKSGIVDGGSKVQYQLDTEFPMFDTKTVKAAYSEEIDDPANPGSKITVNHAATNITDFTIVDLPEDSIEIIRKAAESDTANTGIVVSYYDTATSAWVNLTENTDYTVADYTSSTKLSDKTTGVGATGTGFKLTFADNTVITKRGEKVKVVFSANIVAEPDVNVDPNNNTSELSYNNDFYTGGAKFNDDGVTPPDTPEEPDEPNKKIKSEADVYATAYTVNKVDEKGDPLDGAGFTIYKKGTTTVVGTLDAAKSTTSKFVFTGLGVGKYTIEETTVPTGRKKAANIDFEITAAEDGKTLYLGNFKFDGTDTASVDVINYKGQTLPGTGGIGTYLFTIGGAAIVLLAGVMFVFYMKKRKAED